MTLTTRAELEPLFHGIIDFEETSEGLMPLRLPLATKDFTAPGLWERATSPAGVRIQFVTDAREIALEFPLGEKSDPNDPCTLLDLIRPGCPVQTLPIVGTPEGRELVLPGPLSATEPVEVYFPIGLPLRLKAVHARGATFLRPVEDKRLRWYTYGSSITQCGAARSPSRIWPAVAAGALDWNMTCMGYGGNCQFDQVVARAIAAAPADRISMCLGINTHGGLFSPRTWGPAVEGLIFTIRDKHPGTPILIVSPICCPRCENENDSVESIGLPVMRRRLVEIVQKFRDHGDPHIHYLDGLTLLGPDDVGFLPDGLHPNAEGYEMMGERFAKLAPSAWREAIQTS